MYQFPKNVQYNLFKIDNVVEEEDTVTVEVEEHMSNTQKTVLLNIISMKIKYLIIC